MLTVVASYRQNVRAYPSGGGDYEVATINLGRSAGIVVASALLVDYVLTVAVSISSGVQNAAAAIPALRGNEAPVAVVLVVVLTAINLRGVRESGTAFAIPTYAFMIGVLGMAAFGLYQNATGTLPLAASAPYEIKPAEMFANGFTGVAAAFLVLRAFSSGCAALTGVEAISNGVPAFRKPKSKNAASTLLLMGTLAVTMLMSIVVLGNAMQLRYADDPANQLLLNGTPVGDSYVQETVIGQLSAGIFASFPIGFYWVTAATGIILILAANTAFNGFPVLGSVLARDGFLPRQLHTRGDRLAFSNGIIVLAALALVLIVAFDAQVTKLIQLYIVGVFVSFTLSQTGMVRHWTRLLRTETEPAERARMMRSRVINAFGLVMTGCVLVVVLLTKFTHGAWIAIVAMAVIFFVMQGIRRHYDRVSAELAPDEDEVVTLPSRVRAIVLVSKIHRPTLRALAYARAARPSSLEAVTVDVDPEATAALEAEWDAAHNPGGAEDPRLAVPRGDAPDPRLRARAAALEPARPRHRLHPGVRGRALVGAAAAQPERVAAEGPAALHPRCDGHERPLAAGVQRARRGPLGGERPGRGAPRRPARRGAGRGRTQPVLRRRRGRAARPGRVGPRRRRPPRWTSVARPQVAGCSWRWARSRTAGTASPVTTATSCSCATPCRGSRSRPRSPAPARADGSCGPTPSGSCGPRPDRVEPPCPYAGPGRCGGCDWQHADLSAQRRLKAAVVVEQLERLGRIEQVGGRAVADAVRVEPVPSDRATDGLGWRTRVAYAVAPDGVLGLHRHRSQVVEPVATCRIAHPDVVAAAVTGRSWPGYDTVEVVASGTGEQLVLLDPPPPVGDTRAGRATLERLPVGVAVAGVRGRSWVTEAAAGRRWRVDGAGFWQVHPGAADVLVAAVRELLAPRPGEHLLDLYSGVGLFAGALAGDLGPGGQVDAVEGSVRAVRDARRNLHDLTTVRLHAAGVGPWLAARGPGRVDLVVLDPPRSGAGPAVVRHVLGARPARRRVRRLRPGGPGAGPAHRRGAGLAGGGGPGLRPVPDDAPRRGRRAAAPCLSGRTRPDPGWPAPDR